MDVHHQHHDAGPVAGPHDQHAPPAHAGHDRHEGHSVAMFRDRFWLSLLLTIPVVFWSHEVQMWLGYEAPAFPGSDLIPPILGTIIFLYGGSVFLRGALPEVRDRQPGMMTLIAMAITVAFVTSWAATLGLFEVEIWWELATLITIMLLGHWLEMRSIAQARGALAALADLLPDTAERIVGEAITVVPIAQLAVGDLVLVRPGGRVPADGTVVDGTADVDESMITGESRAVAKETGDAVVAGTVAAGGSLRVRVSAVGDATALSGIMRLVAAAQASASRAQALADRAAALLFYVAVVAAAITLAWWWLDGDPEEALVRTATVLVIACPHALGLAIPLVIAISTSLGRPSRSARQGPPGARTRPRARTSSSSTRPARSRGASRCWQASWRGLASTRMRSSPSGLRWKRTRSTRWRGRSFALPTNEASRDPWPGPSRRWPDAALARRSGDATSRSAAPG